MINENDLGARVEGGPVEVKLMRQVKPFLDIPSKVSITFIDPDLDHAQNVVYAYVQNEVDKETKISIPIVLSQTQAKDLADKTLFLQRLSRITYAFSLPRSYLQYDPGDIIPMLIDGQTVNLLITDIAYDPRGVLNFTAIENDVDLYNLSTNLPPSLPRPPVTRTVPPTTFTSLNINYVSDAHAGSTVYLAALDKERWTGAGLFTSYDEGDSYQSAIDTLEGTFMGTVYSALPAGRVDVIDRVNSIVITPDADQNGTLESVTLLQMLNGSNTLLIGQEILRFAQADLDIDGNITISILQRGVRGTELYMEDHLTEERVILLDNILPAMLEINRSLLIKALSYGSFDTLDSVIEVASTPSGEGFRPYSVCHVTGVRAGNDLTINWQRRTRIGGEWRGAGEVPLSETFERYEIDVYDGLDVVRTIAISDAKTATYTEAQQTTDFGSAQPSITVRIYQLSSVVGRGYYKEAIL